MDTLKIVPGIMSLGVVVNSTKMLPKFKGNKIKPVSNKNMLKGFVGTMVGVGLVDAVSKSI